MHEVLVNRLGGLSLSGKSVVRLTVRPDMTLDVYGGRKTTTQQQQQSHEMADGHTESYISLCVCVLVCVCLCVFVYVFVCVFQNCVQPVTLYCMVEFENNLAQIIIVTRPYVACRNHVLGQRTRSQFTLLHKLQ